MRFKNEAGISRRCSLHLSLLNGLLDRDRELTSDSRAKKSCAIAYYSAQANREIRHSICRYPISVEHRSFLKSSSRWTVKGNLAHFVKRSMHNQAAWCTPLIFFSQKFWWEKKRKKAGKRIYHWRLWCIFFFKGTFIHCYLSSKIPFMITSICNAKGSFEANATWHCFYLFVMCKRNLIRAQDQICRIFDHISAFSLTSFHFVDFCFPFSTFWTSSCTKFGNLWVERSSAERSSICTHVLYRYLCVFVYEPETYTYAWHIIIYRIHIHMNKSGCLAYIRERISFDRIIMLEWEVKVSIKFSSCIYFSNSTQRSLSKSIVIHYQNLWHVYKFYSASFKIAASYT